MLRISTVSRIGLSMTITTISLLLLAHAIGLIPNAEQYLLSSRKTVCETLAIQCCLAAEKEDAAMIRRLTTAFVERNPQVRRMTVRSANGQSLAEARHSRGETTGVVATVPIYRKNLEWGSVEIEFERAQCEIMAARFGSTLVPLTICFGGAVLLANVLVLRRVLTHLDPSSVVPGRVQRTLDTLTEGVVLLDQEERIVMANLTFARYFGRTPNELINRPISDLSWLQEKSEDPGLLPWRLAIQRGEASTGVILRTGGGDGAGQVFAVNVAPIVGADTVNRGAIATFDDLTRLEEKNAVLSELLAVLEKSREEIRTQNEELRYLATRDPLTACLNRRSFFQSVEKILGAPAGQRPRLGCMMVDIDHFKSINDNHGHAMGDKVLQHVSALMRAAVREQDLVCRYGGEEFCILMLDLDLAESARLADEFRRTLEATPCDQLKITTSIGVAIVEPDAVGLQTAMEQADKSLYSSKRNGRNRVTTWQDLVDRGETDVKPEDLKARGSATPAEASPPFSLQSVQVLITALAQRDHDTAEHSRRVANLCLVVGYDQLSERDCYILETAALLHDVGKVGVPDSVLLKAGPLNEQEWKVMDSHSDLGAGMVQLAIACPELREIIRTHHAWYAGNPRRADLPSGEQIPIAARLLSIADAYDAMTSNRVYRRRLRRSDALAELRRCAGTQFDPQLVERFATIIGKACESKAPTSAPVAESATGSPSSFKNLPPLVPQTRLKSQQEEQQWGEIAESVTALIVEGQSTQRPADAMFSDASPADSESADSESADRELQAVSGSGESRNA